MYRSNWLPEVFNDFFNTDILPKFNTTAPAVNVLENAESYKVELAVPGLCKEDFSVRLNQDGNLSVKMENNREKNDEHSHYLRREFSYSKFEQTLVLPDDVDKSKISAQVNDGILTIVLPKLKQEETKVAREINID